jgi:hypothetical protein
MLRDIAEKLLRAVLPLSYMIAFALALVIWLRADA